MASALLVVIGAGTLAGVHVGQSMSLRDMFWLSSSAAAARRPVRLQLCRVAVQKEGLIQPTRDDFENSLRFRVTLRRFLRWSEDQAATAGLTSVQHQLLVAIKGHPGPRPPAIRDLAEYLLLQSHSAVGLVDRAEAAGVVRRQQDENDARVVRVLLTDKGERLVSELTAAHLAELHNLAESLNGLLEATRQESRRTPS